MRVLATALLASMIAGCGIPKSQHAELQSQYQATQEELNAAKAEQERLKKELEEVRERQRKRTERFMSVYEELLKVEAKNLAKVRLEDGRAVLQLESDVLFAPGSAALKPEGLAAVKEIAVALKDGTSAKFQVEGHTDNDPVKSKEFPTNWHLGADRAIVVVQEMVKAGFPPERISAASFSEFSPVAENSSAESKKLNRRIEVVWMPELTDVLPFKRMLRELKEREKEASADANANGNANDNDNGETPAPAPAPEPAPK